MSNFPPGERNRYLLLGIAFVLVAGLFVGLSIAIYQKSFSPAVLVTLRVDRTGSQLNRGADIKVRGVRVGEVRAVGADASGATLTLALDPDAAGLVPADVTARLVPKTLFGERYVDLEIPPTGPRAPAIAAGAVIPADRSAAAIELEQVSDRLLPVLTAVQPAQLSVTLTQLRTALDGRGNALGAALVGLDGYLRGIQPAIPDLIGTLDELSPVADGYARAAPDLFGGLAEATVTTDTLAGRGDQLHALLHGARGAGDRLTDFLDDNADNLVTVLDRARPTLGILARYAPEYPCVFRQLVTSIPTSDRVFGKGSAHPNVQRVLIGMTANRGKYLPGVDTPRYADDRGPRCYGQKPPSPQYPDGRSLLDGSRSPGPPLRIPNPLDLRGWLARTDHGGTR
jgi:virulence factor Mce-like protein